MRTSFSGGSSLMSEKLLEGVEIGADSPAIKGSTENAGFSSTSGAATAGAADAVTFGATGFVADMDCPPSPAAAAFAFGVSRTGALTVVTDAALTETAGAAF